MADDKIKMLEGLIERMEDVKDTLKKQGEPEESGVATNVESVTAKQGINENADGAMVSSLPPTRESGGVRFPRSFRGLGRSIPRGRTRGRAIGRGRGRYPSSRGLPWYPPSRGGLASIPHPRGLRGSRISRNAVGGRYVQPFRVGSSRGLFTRSRTKIRKTMQTTAVSANPQKFTPFCLEFNRTGKCTNKRCVLTHDASRVRICPDFLRGKCENGKCPLSHNPVKSRMPTCLSFLRESCPHSAETCRFRHVKVSTNAEICVNFLGGECLDGEYCKFLHSWTVPRGRTKSLLFGRKKTEEEIENIKRKQKKDLNTTAVDEQESNPRLSAPEFLKLTSGEMDSDSIVSSSNAGPNVDAIGNNVEVVDIDDDDDVDYDEDYDDAGFIANAPSLDVVTSSTVFDFDGVEDIGDS